MNLCDRQIDATLLLANLSQRQIAQRLQPIAEAYGESCKTDSNTLPESNSASVPQPSAVLVPLLRRGGEWRVLLIRRSQSVPHHKGQIAFPGGRWEAEDGSMLATAVRETREELGEGMRPKTVLGALFPVTTNSTGFIIHPFVAVFDEPLSLEPDRAEVEEVLIMPLAAFLTPSNTEPLEFDHENVNIWGATARIAGQFINRLQLQGRS